MKRLIPLWKAVVLVWLASIGPVFAAQMEFPGPYFGEVIRVIDGDTFEAKIEIWPTISATVSVRLKGVDAPELRRSECPQERLGAAEAKDAMEDILPMGTRVRLENVEKDAFAGRVVADVFKQGEVRGSTLTTLMIRRAMVLPWVPGDPDIDWCNDDSVVQDN
ncbi:MAG: thermonuclease family protein [Albidovulum sp.]